MRSRDFRCVDTASWDVPATFKALEKAGEVPRDEMFRVFNMGVGMVLIASASDTPALLAQYVPAFDPRFLGLYGDAEATAHTAREFKIIYQKVPGSSAGTYTMDHSAGTYVFDPHGRLRLYVANGQGADVFAHDLRELLRAG